VSTARPHSAIRGGAVRIRDVRRHFGAIKALDGVSLDVVAGEFIALLGPSGSGKTTLLMTVAGFEIPDAGRIAVDGYDVTDLPPSKRDLGMVFQRYALFPHLNVRDNIGFPLRMRGVDEASRNTRAEAMLETVGLEGYGDRFPVQLSGGQQQRIALARAIVYEPPVLLMDEPLSALDKNLRERMRLEIKRLQKQLGITVIFVTHDQEEALVMADRIAVMDKGKLVQEGAPRTLYDAPCNAFVAGFLGETNFLQGEVIGAEQDATILKLADGQIVAGMSVASMSTGVITGKASLSIRPEHIAVAQNESADKALKASVRDIIFAGASTIMLADAGFAEPINIRLASGVDLSGFTHDAPVWLSWQRQTARVFAA
jgi:spermidine/putrescine ABC transporter ATP-binding subunit